MSLELISEQVFGVWFLIGAALVLFMRSGQRWLKRVSHEPKIPEIF